MIFPYKAYNVYIWDPKYAKIIYAPSASKAKSSYYSLCELDENLSFFDAIRQMIVRRVNEFDKLNPVLDESLDYVNQRYNKDFKFGQLVNANGVNGWILRGRGGHVIVGHGDNREHIYHPNDVMMVPGGSHA